MPGTPDFSDRPFMKPTEHRPDTQSMELRPTVEPPPIPPPIAQHDAPARRAGRRDPEAAAELARMESKVGNGARNLGMVLALGLVFLGAASLIKPDPRSATASPADGAAALPPSPRTLSAEEERIALELARTPHPAGWKPLGMLQDTRYHVLIHASPAGPRYSIFTLKGRLLQGDMHADDVYRSFPDLDLTKLRLDPQNKTQSIMYADPATIGD